MTEQSRPKPIELVASEIVFGFRGIERDVRVSELTTDELRGIGSGVISILIKHGCISIEGIIARDEELARVAPVPERAGE